MKRNRLIVMSLCLGTALLFAACSQKYPGYKQTSDGLYYKFYDRNSSAPRPQRTDFLEVKMLCYLNDTLYYDWKETGGIVHVQLSEPHFKGDLQSAYGMLHVGDSASFYIKADSIAMHYYGQRPDSVGLAPEDFFRYEMKLVGVQTEKEFRAGIERLNQEKMDASHAALEAYIKEHDIEVNPLESGVYIVQTEKGKGASPGKGDLVEVDFQVNLLDGTQVGSTFDSDEKFSFVLGEGYTIEGWEEIMPQMHVGERVKAIIPFEKAYGGHAVQMIPPYSNLVYDIKLLKITKAADLQRQAEQQKRDLKAMSEQAFRDYLSQFHIVDHTASGLYYAKTVVTEGARPVEGSTARIRFAATYLDGSPLGSSEQLGGSYDVAYGRGTVLKGLEEGIGLMRVGEKARFVLPYPLAYGEKPYGNIPAYSNLVFDVELLEIVDGNN